MIPPEAVPDEDGMYHTHEYGKAPPEMERKGEEAPDRDSEGMSPLMGSQTLRIQHSGGYEPGADVWLRVKGRVKASQSAGSGELELELGEARLDPHED